MTFWELNRKKAMAKLLIVFFIWGFLNFVYWLAIRNQHPTEFVASEIRTSMFVSAMFAVIFFSIHFFGYWNYFNKDKYLLSALLHRGIFGENRYEFGTLFSNSRLAFTRESVFGIINGYPVVVCFNSYIGQRTSSSLDVHVFILQLNKTQKKTLSIAIAEHYLPDHIEQQIFDFVEGLKSKGYVPGNVKSGKYAESMVSIWG